MSAIYGLYDQSSVLLYIGKANDPAQRLKGHMRDSRRRNTPLYSWIRKHGAPSMRIIDANCDDWRTAERLAIAEGRSRGECRLNVADGGDEPFCPTDTRQANGKRNAEARDKRLWALKRALGDILKRGFVSETTKAKMRARPDVFGQFAELLG